MQMMGSKARAFPGPKNGELKGAGQMLHVCLMIACSRKLCRTDAYASHEHVGAQPAFLGFCRSMVRQISIVYEFPPANLRDVISATSMHHCNCYRHP